MKRLFLLFIAFLAFVTFGFSAIDVNTTAITFDTTATGGLTVLFLAVMGILGLIFLFRKIMNFINGS